MILFLQQDTDREKPVGYEIERTNIFDPEDDLIPFPIHQIALAMMLNAWSMTPREATMSKWSQIELIRSLGRRTRQLRNQNLTCAAARCVRKPRLTPSSVLTVAVFARLSLI
jgi:hypothetical protein